VADAPAAVRSVILLRHTPLADAAGICYGRSERTLATSATIDMANVLATLPAFDRVVSSPAERCRRLAVVAACTQRAATTGVSLDARWLEIDFGRWEGLAWDAVPRGELDAWAADTWDYAPGGGESARQLYARVAQALQDLRAEPRGGRTLVVTHAGPLRAAAVALQGLSFAEHFSVRAEPGAWIELAL
jgi:alpha-ribazole phosphatase